MFFTSLTPGTRDIGIQCFYRYSRVLSILNSIIHSITIPVQQKNKFLSVINKTSIPCILHTYNTYRNLYYVIKELRIISYEELRSHFPYIAKFVHSIVCLHSSFIVYKYYIRIMCWAYTITINSTNPLTKQCNIP